MEARHLLTPAVMRLIVTVAAQYNPGLADERDGKQHRFWKHPEYQYGSTMAVALFRHQVLVCVFNSGRYFDRLGALFHDLRDRTWVENVMHGLYALPYLVDAVHRELDREAPDSRNA